MVDGVEILRKTKYFLGKYEIEIDDAGNERKLHYISAGDGVFAIVEKVNQADAQIHYIHKNYLGSYDAITNHLGVVEERLSFDPWGRRRNPSTGIVDDGIYSMFDRGFTGHQHLDEFGLINMNGRLYDPVLARFLSPDPFVQAPDNLQNHNRYSYALNNPLRYTDPSGEWIHLAIGAFIGGIINWATHGAQFNAAGLGYFGVGALAGGLAAGIGAGVGGLVSGAGSFSFSVPSSLAQLGFLPGAAVGGSAGITNGLISGTGNSLVSGTTIGESLARGLESAWKQGLTGAAIGGISAGIDAVAHGRNFLTGHAKGSMYVSAERLSINVPEQKATRLNADDMVAELDDLNTHIIEVARTTETNQSTISTFSVDEGQLEGYFLEPAGPSSVVEGSGLRIQEGIYELGSYSSARFDHHFELLNVPGRSQILIHGGTGPLNTSGCLIIGNNVGLNSISGWQEMMGQLRTYINNNGGTRNFYIIIQ